MVTAVVTYGSGCVGLVGPFPVDIPWWAEVEPVVAHLEQTLGVPVLVLRLLHVEGSDGARDGQVTYHVAALEPPGRLPACDFVDDGRVVSRGSPDIPRASCDHPDVARVPAARQDKTYD